MTIHDETMTVHRDENTAGASANESGKVGKALLMWMFGVPGFIVVLYLLFGG